MSSKLGNLAGFSVAGILPVGDVLAVILSCQSPQFQSHKFPMQERYIRSCYARLGTCPGCIPGLLNAVGV